MWPTPSWTRSSRRSWARRRRAPSATARCSCCRWARRSASAPARRARRPSEPVPERPPPPPRDAELLAPAFARLLAELGAAPDPDMALNNLERYAAVVDRGVFFQTLAVHPGAAHLLARLRGWSPVLADRPRPRPKH